MKLATALRHRFSSKTKPQTVRLSKAGQYTINVVFPPLSFITGRAHFSADFTIRSHASGVEVPYHALGRALLSANKTDMSGNASYPLGHFECAAPGNYEITCLTPQNIRSDFQIEVAPYVSPLTYVPLILGIILSACMLIGGVIVSLLKMAEKI
ncbi:hypothetical protein AAIB41_10340 [Brucella sp. BE17]|uniref:hypothetical protein n=1 Tax=Brucella sp. BE17 TaxID=3142977 RepID=UPI0031BAACA4